VTSRWSTEWSDSCCPNALEDDDDGLMFLNSTCDFPGHCVQMKDAFVHIECAGDLNEEDCVLCELSDERKRSSSVDDTAAFSQRSFSL